MFFANAFKRSFAFDHVGGTRQPAAASAEFTIGSRLEAAAAVPAGDGPGSARAGITGAGGFADECTTGAGRYDDKGGGGSPAGLTSAKIDGLAGVAAANTTNSPARDTTSSLGSQVDTN
jgi:hypothetical protein